MMSASSVASHVMDLAAYVTAAGPAALEYDGLRALQHPERLQLFIAGRGHEVTPLTVDLWPSLSCNARCPLCPYRLSGARTEADQSDDLMLLDLEQARVILAGAADAGVRSVILTGGGDPLLHPDLVQIARVARETGLRWALFTNGLALDAATAASLLAEEPSFLRVSVDAGTGEQHAQVYGLPEGGFEPIIRNAIAAAEIAGTMKARSFGLSFTLDPSTSESEMESIQALIKRVFVEGGGGLTFVAFRPRIVHYKHGRPCVSQPHRGRFQELARAIRGVVMEPLESFAAGMLRFDLKEGLFARADQVLQDPSCLSTAWMTTVDHQGVGYITAELAGVRGSRQVWGTLRRLGDFRDQWLGELRTELSAEFENGQIGVPLVHRTSPVDAFLRSLKEVLGNPVDGGEAEVITKAISRATWYRSPNPDFV